MFEEIRKPKLLMQTPMIIIRALPSIYYYLKYHDKREYKKATNLFSSSLAYLVKACQSMGDKLGVAEFTHSSDAFNKLLDDGQKQSLQTLDDLVIGLAELCTMHQVEVREFIKKNRPELIELYKENVSPLSILLIDNNNEAERCSVLSNSLVNFCRYKVKTETLDTPQFTEHLLDSDFGVFISTHPARIHEDAKMLNSYNKPGLAIAYLDKEINSNAQSIRHGAQLNKTGFPVLFKVYTPIRLYTSIEKEFMRFHLQ